MNTVFVSIFSLTAMGVVCAAVLCIASRFMYVRVDERIARLLEYLPGVNCGACGFAGCAGYAATLISGEKIKTNLCTPGGPEVSSQVSAILGLEAESFEHKYAVVHCRGDSEARQKKMEYRGIQTCEAAKQLYGGETSCAFGCLGYGDCKIVCPHGAICMENSLARINPKLCTGCGLCVKACPNSIISVENAGIAVSVLCKSIERGALVRKKCSRSCIGCGKCVRVCLSGAIKIEDNLAIIDQEKCSLCGGCAEVCVSGSIQRMTQMTGK